MSSWIYASEDSVRGKSQRGESLWARIHKLYHNTQAENPNELNERNIESMKGRWKRLNKNGNKWVAVCREANARRRSGMSDNDVEKEAHSIYEAGGNKLVVFNEVMSKHPKWNVHDTTHVFHRQSEDVDDQQSGGSSKRSKTSEDGGFSISSNPETPTSEQSIATRPTGRDKAKRKGKVKVSQSECTHESVVAVEIHAMRLTIDVEAELIKTRIELEREKLQRNAMKMKENMLLQLLAKEHLSPEDEEMKRQLTKIVFGE
ncbi:glutathione S-transferase T2-like [Salvia miltiorrhiza]|uniref:glutathione S-transferase T2-like n=1 Tax=Salvia miltiorrhiza TaxID=226208 RepID=UPI0025AB9008|nr:glutathione S-transferase T2-like [Salvia miltiorrhiza]